MSGYDNTNRGALWSSTGFTGNANVDGHDYTAEIVATNSKKENAPSHMLYLRDRESVKAIALWRPKKPDAKFAASGKCEELGFTAFVYKNTKTDKPNSPPLTISFVPMDTQVPPQQHRQTQAASNAFDDDSSGVPF